MFAPNSTEGSHSELGPTELRAIEEDASLHMHTLTTPDVLKDNLAATLQDPANGDVELPDLGSHLVD